MREIKFRAWSRFDQKMISCKSLMTQPWNVFGSMVKQNGDWKFMQHTGLKDKNGKEIYEGDILKGSGDWNKAAIVEWEGGGFHGVGGYTHMGWTFFELMEIIGNIYENPELLSTLIQ